MARFFFAPTPGGAGRAASARQARPATEVRRFLVARPSRPWISNGVQGRLGPAARTGETPVGPRVAWSSRGFAVAGL